MASDSSPRAKAGPSALECRPNVNILSASVRSMFYCKERVQLVKDWRDAVVIFSECVAQLEACKSDKVRFEKRYEITVAAREVAEQARAQMVSHRAEHGC